MLSFYVILTDLPDTSLGNFLTPLVTCLCLLSAWIKVVCRNHLSSVFFLKSLDNVAQIGLLSFVHYRPTLVAPFLWLQAWVATSAVLWFLKKWYGMIIKAVLLTWKKPWVSFVCVHTIILLCVWVFSLCGCLCIIWLFFLQRLEEGVEFSGTGDTHSCQLPCRC